jgi:hypothetical protein
VLLVTTTIGVVHGVHGHTSHLGPLVALHSVLVVSTAGLQDGLVGTSTASHQANHSAALVADGLLRAGRQADSADSLIGVLRHNDGIVAGRAAHLATVANLLLNVANDSTFGDLSDGQDVSNSKNGCKTITTQEILGLAGRHGLKEHEKYDSPFLPAKTNWPLYMPSGAHIRVLILLKLYESLN